jgi:iron complex transport system permease protein
MRLAQGVRVGPVGMAWRPRVVAVCAAVLLAVVAVTVAGMTIGQYPIRAGDVVRVLLGGGESEYRYIVLELRLPRALVGALVGLALGMAGALTQTFARNPLATPDILGVTGGASAGAVAMIVLGGGTYAVTSDLLRVGLPAAALVGGLIAAAVVYGLSWRSGIDSYRLILVGIGCAAVLTALTSWLLVRSQLADAAQASVWLAGSLNSRTWDHAVPLAIAVAVLMPAGLALTGALRVAQLGDDTARALGVRLELTQFAIIGVAVGLTAAAVAAAGPVGFVAFVVPQLALRLTGGSRPPLLASALVGALLLQTADLLARSVFTWEVPVGLVTTVLGAPYLIFLLIRHRREVSA